MKKKSIIVCMALFPSLLLMAGGRTIVIRQNPLLNAGKTQVTSHPGTGVSDTLVVTPAASATVIDIKVRDHSGTVIEHHVVPADLKATISLTDDGDTSPTMLQIGDDEGTVYEE